MKVLRLVLFVSAMLFSGFALADDASKAEAEKLLDAMGMEALMEQSIENIVDMQMKQQPDIAPYKDVMLTFFKKYMSYKSMKPDFVALYANEFTSAELKDMRNFYETPTGKKTIKKLPDIMNKGSLIGIKKVQENMPELMQMIKAESEKNGKKQKQKQTQ